MIWCTHNDCIVYETIPKKYQNLIEPKNSSRYNCFPSRCYYGLHVYARPMSFLYFSTLTTESKLLASWMIKPTIPKLWLGCTATSRLMFVLHSGATSIRYHRHCTQRCPLCWVCVSVQLVHSCVQICIVLTRRLRHVCEMISFIQWRQPIPDNIEIEWLVSCLPRKRVVVSCIERRCSSSLIPTVVVWHKLFFFFWVRIRRFRVIAEQLLSCLVMYRILKRQSQGTKFFLNWFTSHETPGNPITAPLSWISYHVESQQWWEGLKKFNFIHLHFVRMSDSYRLWRCTVI